MSINRALQVQIGMSTKHPSGLDPECRGLEGLNFGHGNPHALGTLRATSVCCAISQQNKEMSGLELRV